MRKGILTDRDSSALGRGAAADGHARRGDRTRRWAWPRHVPSDAPNLRLPRSALRFSL